MTSSAAATPSKAPALLRFGWLLPLVTLFLGLGILLITYAFASIPLPKEVPLASSAEVYDRDGELIGIYSDEVRRFLVDTGELPRYLKQAVVAAEDRGFFEHNGVSVRGIARAAWANITGGEIRQGGSTITQQYVKNAVLQDDAQTLSRKAREAILAVKLERRFSKRQILGFYLNTIYLGRSTYGIEAAARSYFDKHASELTLPEAAYVVGIIPSPESYQADENPRIARDRRNQVLQLMAQQDYISAKRADRASRGPVKLASGALGRIKHQQAAYFMEWLRREYLYPKYGNRLYTGGLKIHTTLDLDMQHYAEEAISGTLTEPHDPQAALVSMTPSGALRAFVGGTNYTSVKKARGFNYASSLPGRQAGSSFKPFTLLAAIEQGISPRSYFPGGSPATVTDPACADADGGPWQPENYGGAAYGTITLDEATTNSVNTVYAQLVAEIGPGALADRLGRFEFDRTGTGSRRTIAPNCSLALGTLDVTPLEMARAYAAFAGRGVLPEVEPIRYVTDSNDRCLDVFREGEDRRCMEHSALERRRVADQRAVDVLNQTLTHVVEGGTATAAAIGRPVAGKTGTTQDNVDAWFAGHVPQLATVVWMGYPARPRPGGGGLEVPQMGFCAPDEFCKPVHGIEVTGGSFPAEIWAAYMARATQDLPIEPFPVAVDTGSVLNPPPPPEPTPSPTPEPSPSESPSPTSTPEPSPSETPSVTPTPEPSDTPSEEPTPTLEPSPEPSDTPPEEPSPEPEPSPSDSAAPGPSPDDPPGNPAPAPPDDPSGNLPAAHGGRFPPPG